MGAFAESGGPAGPRGAQGLPPDERWGLEEVIRVWTLDVLSGT